MSFRKNFGRCGAAALAVAGALVALPAMAADHRDGAAAVDDPTSDINDVYTFMNGENLVLAMTVHPFAPEDALFSSEVQFVWNIDAWGGFLDSLSGAPDITTQVQCEFDEAQMASCWVHRAGEIHDYVTGDASAAEGLVSDGGTRVFAGLRADPFYFYLTGFTDARQIVLDAVNAGEVDLTNGTLCPELTDPQLDALADALTATGPNAQNLNDFLGANTLAIVVEVPKALVSDVESPVVSVHASTHAKP